MTESEDQTYTAIIQGTAPPPRDLGAAGWDGHQAGKQFHENPNPIHTVAGLCWRIGWNNRAMGHGQPGTAGIRQPPPAPERSA